MMTSVSRSDRGYFSRSALANTLCNPPPSPFITMTTSNLSERVRKLQEMLMERQSSGSTRPSYRESLMREKKMISQNHYNLPRPSSKIAEKNALSLSNNVRNNASEKRERPTILIEHYDDSKTGGESIKNSNSTICPVKTGIENNGPKEVKEKSRTVKKYLGNLTSTRYLHHIFSPIIKDSSSESKKFRRTSSAKQVQSDGDVCAIVVPSESTTQVPVIKRRSWIKEGDSSDVAKDNNNGKSDAHCNDAFLSPINKESTENNSPAIASGSFKKSNERRKSKRVALVSEEKLSKLPFLSLNVVKNVRPKSAIYDANVDTRSLAKGNFKEPFNDGNSTVNHESDKLVSPLSAKMLGVVRNGSLKRDASFRQNFSTNESSEKESSKNSEVEEVQLESAKVASAKILKESQQLSVETKQMEVEDAKISEQSSMDRRINGIRRVPTEPLFSKITDYDNSRLGPYSYLKSSKRFLPPLPSIEDGQEDCQENNFSNTENSVASTVRPRKGNLKYGRSNTTSTYNGYKDAAPDASPRRHLIGFLHRTSHLSLTSELSADASFYLIGHRAGRRYDDSTIGSESDARLFSDDDERSRVSTSTDITSVSRQHQANAYRKRRNRRKFRQPSRASSFSSITESSMSLDVITVTLNMDTVNFLGISIVGQSSLRGDNGIYVANIMKGGAVALDGRIEPGDMILQVNDISFENFTNDQAVDVLKESVARRGPIKLTVAKMYDGGPRSAFTVPRRTDEPVRPIDTQAWVQHTNAMRGMPSILEEGTPTPIPGHYGRPPSSSTVTSNGSIPNTIVAGAHLRLDTSVSKLRVVQAMAMPNSGLEIKDRTWLKIPIPMSFLGSDLVDWLMEHVDGLRDRKEARKYASDLLKEKLICHAVSRSSFTEQCYYKLGEECSDFVRIRQDQNLNEQCVRSEVGVVLPPPPAGLMTTAVPPGSRNWQTSLMPQGAPSMVSGYASMPISPYPSQNPQVAGMMLGAGGPGMMYKGGGGPDVHSQASSADGSSGSEHRRATRAILPPAPMPSLSGPSHHLLMGNSVSSVAGPSVGVVQTTLGELPQDLTSSRQSFRLAMNQPYEFFVDNL